jgi:Transglycosylase SLT domain
MANSWTLRPPSALRAAPPTSWRSEKSTHSLSLLRELSVGLRGILLVIVISLQSNTSFAAKAPDRTVFAKSVCAAVDKASTTHNLDRIFFTRLLWKESLFDPNAVSPAGAQGIAQFMPDTADRRKLDDPFDPLAAISASASFLSDLEKEFGNLGLAAAAYNAGEGRITRWLAGNSSLPDETEGYVASITGKAADEWKDKAADHAMPALGKTGDFTSQCVALASRKVNPTSVSGVRRGKSQPWGALLAADFNESRALGLFRRLKLRFPQVLDGVQPFVVRKANLSRGRKKMAFVMVGAKTQAAAQGLCSKYASVGLPCVVRKSR